MDIFICLLHKTNVKKMLSSDQPLCLFHLTQTVCLQLAKVCWWYWFSKLIELADTVSYLNMFSFSIIPMKSYLCIIAVFTIT